MKKTFLALAATLALASAAEAAVVTYEFSVTIDTTGTPFSGLTYDGSFSYDDAVPGGTGAGGESLFPLTAFSFLFDRPYALPDLTFGDAAFEGTRFVGLDAGGATFAFVPGVGGAAPFFAFDFGRGVAGNGSFTARAVPEPLSAALVGLALVGLAGLRRRC